MIYKFDIWEHGLGNPQEILDLCKWVRANLPDAKLPSHDDGDQEIIFRIVDVRPGRYDSAAVNGLVERLTKLMLGDEGLLSTIDRNAQLLFIGSTPSLSERALDETDEGEPKRDIKRDVEFAIRTLRKYGVAIYGCVDADVSLTHAALERFPLTCSGIRLFEQQYSQADPDSLPSSPALSSARRGVEVRRAAQRIGEDFRALVASARSLPEFAKLGVRVTQTRSGLEELDLLREIGILFELGKGERPLEFSPRKRLDDLMEVNALTFEEKGYAHSSYGLFVQSLGRLANWVDAYQPTATAAGISVSQDEINRHEIEREISLDMFKLERFNLLRDFGRVLGQGALPRLRQWMHGDQHILIVDDWLHEALLKDAAWRALPPERAGERAAEMLLVDRLRKAIAVAWNDAVIRVVRSDVIDANGEFSASHFARILRLDGDEPRERVLDLDGNESEWPRPLERYAVVLIDPESTRDELGAIRVHRLAKYFEQIRRPGPAHVSVEDEARQTPPIIAFSQRESSGYVQQCLNMGASAFVAKHRPYHLLFDLARALKDPEAFRDDTPGASQFRLLRSLKPHAVDKLKRVGVPFYIYGGIERVNGDIEYHELQKDWVRVLPKADLHYHFGTAIDLDTVALLASNTAGYFLQAAEDGEPGKLHPSAEELVDRIVFAVRLAAHLARDNRRIPHIELLAAAAHGVQSEGDLKWKRFGLGDALVEQLFVSNERCDAPHATALLVTAIDLLSADAACAPPSGGDAKPEQPPPAERQQDVDAYFSFLSKLSAAAREKVTGTPFGAEDALVLELNRTHRHYQRLAYRWAGDPSLPGMNGLIQISPDKFWGHLRDRISERIDLARRYLWAAANAKECREFPPSPASDEWDLAEKRARSWLDANRPHLGVLAADQPEMPNLRTYCCVAYEPRRRGLQLYLRGADLLGSAHLQYPENLLIAAHAVTRDNATQNVIYSEVRCETTGYTQAGMGAHDATEMLRHGFNLASLFWASQPIEAADAVLAPIAASRADSRRRYPLVRTNILLAAKRHKDESKARAVVELLDHYLERRPFDADRGWSRNGFYREFPGSVPNWWRPCDVVGFDVSGNEAEKAEWLERIIGQLASRSSPITIHAGEAASAESIWHAVYKLNALRIGHGLRLGENLALLNYCVREGICMELCPNSNFHTNAFRPPNRRFKGDLCKEESLYLYPLRRYMLAGMEVTIGTDNRYLHPEEAATLTSEYLMAARLAGGLTRWEVLQIVKAGFKNAFLDKSEVRELIGAAEEAIYRIVASDRI